MVKWNGSPAIASATSRPPAPIAISAPGIMSPATRCSAMSFCATLRVIVFEFVGAGRGRLRRGVRVGPFAAAFHVVLPDALLLDDDGSFVGFQRLGRIQPGVGI